MCYNIASVLCLGFLAVRHVGSYIPVQGLNPNHPHWKANSEPQGNPWRLVCYNHQTHSDFKHRHIYYPMVLMSAV